MNAPSEIVNCVVSSYQVSFQSRQRTNLILVRLYLTGLTQTGFWNLNRSELSFSEKTKTRLRFSIKNLLTRRRHLWRLSLILQPQIKKCFWKALKSFSIPIWRNIFCRCLVLSRFKTSSTLFLKVVSCFAFKRVVDFIYKKTFSRKKYHPNIKVARLKFFLASIIQSHLKLRYSFCLLCRSS